MSSMIDGKCPPLVFDLLVQDQDNYDDGGDDEEDDNQIR